MDKSKQTILLEEMDILFDKFVNCKAYFPYLAENNVGAREFETGRLYASLGYDIKFGFNKPMTLDNLNKHNELSHWLNQNFIIRLYSLMESYKYKYPFDGKIDGYEEVNILRKLRDIFAHSSDKYNEDKEKQKTMLLEVVKHFKLEEQNPDHIPLPIDKVIIPMFNKCKIYINNKVN